MVKQSGSFIVGALIFAAVLGFLWMTEFAVRLTDRIQTERVQHIESRAELAASAEWARFEALLKDADPNSGPLTLEYRVPDGLSTREVRLRVEWREDAWIVTERQAVWHATPVSP